MAGTFESEFTTKQLTSEYISAKIIANPYDYTLTDRILFEDSMRCAHVYSIYNKGNSTERYLAHALDCDIVNGDYIKNNPRIANIKLSLEDFWQPIEEFNVCYGYDGYFIKYNNLIVNEDWLIKDAKFLINPTAPETCKNKAVAKYLEEKQYLKSLEVLVCQCFNKSSLIANLMYLLTSFENRSLNDIEDITFAKEAVDAKVCPLFEESDKSTDIITMSTAINSCIVPIYPFVVNTDYPISYQTKDENVNYAGKLGLMQSIIYGCEMLYQYSKITNEDVKENLETLFSVNYKAHSFCDMYLYSYSPSTNELTINPNVQACFYTNNVDRFNAFREYFNDLLEKDIFPDMPFEHLDTYGMPIIFGKLVSSMHGYAYQIARVKHAVLLYNLAKEKGVLNPADFTETLAHDELFSMAGLTGGKFESDEETNELIDLSNFATTSTTTAEDKDITDVPDKYKETPPALNASDILKNDLHSSPYKYDINYVKNKASYKDTYNVIAKDISLITHELTRQIKEIKTYNTGGKQSGLLTGKLDKKNLWKYKSDPKIFCNNDYKLKELDLAFGCILDESGSMYGEKIKNGRIVMIMLHEVLNSLGINHSIIGHTSSTRHQTTIFKYFQFKEEAHYSLEKPYCLVAADDRNGNCDSGALYYMQSTMKQVRNKDKIVIIFSDGQPTECTDLELTNQVRDMEKNGIHVIGVGINFSSIKNYYPDNANGKNLKDMVAIVVSILKRYVLEKKEG